MEQEHAKDPLVSFLHLPIHINKNYAYENK